MVYKIFFLICFETGFFVSVVPKHVPNIETTNPNIISGFMKQIETYPIRIGFRFFSV